MKEKFFPELARRLRQEGGNLPPSLLLAERPFHCAVLRLKFSDTPLDQSLDSPVLCSAFILSDDAQLVQQIL